MFHISRLISNEIQIVKQQFPERKIILQNVKKLPSNNIKHELLLTEFSSAFREILHNACKHTHSNSPIVVIGEKKATNLFVSVLDYGPGIPEKNIEKVLNQPKQTTLNTSHKNEPKPHGLAIAKTAIENINGNILIKNHTGVGLLVTLKL